MTNNPDPNTPPPLLTVPQVAEQLQVSEKTVRRLVDDGQLDVLRVGAGRGVLRFEQQAIDAYKRACLAPAVTRPQVDDSLLDDFYAAGD